MVFKPFEVFDALKMGFGSKTQSCATLNPKMSKNSHSIICQQQNRPHRKFQKFKRQNYQKDTCRNDIRCLEVLKIFLNLFSYLVLVIKQGLQFSMFLSGSKGHFRCGSSPWASHRVERPCLNHLKSQTTCPHIFLVCSHICFLNTSRLKTM